MHKVGPERTLSLTDVSSSRHEGDSSNMAFTARRQFLQQTAFTVGAFCGSPIKALAGAPRVFEVCEQNAAPVDVAAIRKLASEITGQVITPDAPDYNSSRLVFNRAFDRRPALVVRCANAPDVARALLFVQNQEFATGGTRRRP